MWAEMMASPKIILKGIMMAKDALLTIEHGADGIVACNHGGHQLDSASSTIEALPEIEEAFRCHISGHS